MGGNNKASLCILACGCLEGVQALIDSARALGDFEVEVVIGDNSPSIETCRLLRGLANVWFLVTDRELWFEGFGAVKQKIVNAASNPWCILGDPDEIWFPEHIRFTGGVQRTVMGDISHGRVFDRRQYRLMGMIHEELYRRTDRRNWSYEAMAVKPFARIEHRPEGQPLWYQARKKALYENLLYRISSHPEMSPGTASYWWTTYWPKFLAENEDFAPTSFEEWSSRYGRENE